MCTQQQPIPCVVPEQGAPGRGAAGASRVPILVDRWPNSPTTASMDGPGLQAQSRSDSNTLRERARPKTGPLTFAPPPLPLPSLRAVHGSSARSAYSNFLMPAMVRITGSLTRIVWRAKADRLHARTVAHHDRGRHFRVEGQGGRRVRGGRVLLTIETDKASIDVEAQDDGIMGKILVRPVASPPLASEPACSLHPPTRRKTMAPLACPSAS